MLSRQLAQFAMDIFRDGAPAKILQRMPPFFIDQFGLQLGGATFPWSIAARKAILHAPCPGRSTVNYYGDKVSAEQAAFINALSAHATDFDDSHIRAQTHPGSVVIPTALAVAEEVRASGKQTQNAIVAGMEIMLRLSHAISPACINGGHHTPPTVGPFGAAITAGLLLELPVTQLVHALGIAGSYAGGLVEYSQTGGEVKRLHTAIPTTAGIRAALFAREGLTGPTHIFEGKKGLFFAFAKNEAKPERIFSELGNNFLLEDLSIKPFNCCFLIHPAIEALTHIYESNHLHIQDIKEIIVETSAFALSHVGSQPEPHDILGAQFSMHYTLALSLLKELPGLHSYTEVDLHNIAIRKLAQKVKVIQSSEVEAIFSQKNAVRVTVNTTAGHTFNCFITDPKGSPGNPLTLNETIEKFHKNTRNILEPEQANVLLNKLKNFAEIKDISDLFVSLVHHSGNKTKLRI